MLDAEQDVLTVTDIKQWEYCQRVVYFERCLPNIRPTTYLMKHGQALHQEQPRHAVRRVLPDELQGERLFSVRYHSPVLGLSGLLDEVIRTSDGQVIPVDYKSTQSVANNHKLQLACYALLIEAVEGVKVSFGYIYLMPKRQTLRVAIDDALKQKARDTTGRIRAMVEREQIPPKATNANLCVGCEFRRFCNDVG
jgi:CRISPR-associated exonuclease Cas4